MSLSPLLSKLSATDTVKISNGVNANTARDGLKAFDRL